MGFRVRDMAPSAVAAFLADAALKPVDDAMLAMGVPYYVQYSRRAHPVTDLIENMIDIGQCDAVEIFGQVDLPAQGQCRVHTQG